MKLRQLLKAHFDTNGPTPMGRGITDYILTPPILSVYKEELDKCLEFASSEIIILNEVKSGKPQRVISGYDEEGVPISTMKLSTVSLDNEPIITTKFSETTKFAPIVKIYSISLTPEIFDPTDIFTTKLDTAVISPTIYDNADGGEFTPTKRIIITYSPERAQDDAMKELKHEIREMEQNEEKPEFTVKTDKDSQDSVIKESETGATELIQQIDQEVIVKKIQEKEETYKQKLLDMLSDCLTNPNQYKLPTKRGILIRLTQDSLIQNDEQIWNPEDKTVTLNTK